MSVNVGAQILLKQLCGGSYACYTYAQAAATPIFTADVVYPGNGNVNDRRARTELVSTSTEIRTSRLTHQIKDLLASVRMEPLAHKADRRQQTQMRPDAEQPETPRLNEAVRELGRTWSPGCPSPSPEQAQTPSPGCYAAALRDCSHCPDPNSRSKSPESCHDSAEQLHDSGRAANSLGSASESYKTAKSVLTSGSSHSRTDTLSSGLHISVPGLTNTMPISRMTEAEQALWDGAAPSDMEDLSDGGSRAIEDGELDSCGSSSAKDICVPASLERGPVQVQLSIHSAPMGRHQQQQQQSIYVRLYVTEVLQGVGYVAACCSPEPVQDGGSPGDHPLDLEWLRHVHVEQARHYLMDVAGVLLLTDHLITVLKRAGEQSLKGLRSVSSQTEMQACARRMKAVRSESQHAIYSRPGHSRAASSMCALC